MVSRRNILSFGGNNNNNNNVSLSRLHDSQRCAVKYRRAIKHTPFSRYLKLTAGGVKQPTVRDRAREKEIKTGIDFSPSPSVHPPRVHYGTIMVFMFFSPPFCHFHSLMWSFWHKNFSSERTAVSLPSRGSFPVRKRKTDLTRTDGGKQTLHCYKNTDPPPLLHLLPI